MSVPHFRSPTAALILALFAVPLVPAPVRAGTPAFLTLPFESGAQMRIQQGWTSASDPGHHGIDYVRGPLDAPAAWRGFPVLAAADGYACANCTSRHGDAVWMRHDVHGATYYTYYGHLASVTPRIPRGGGGAWVRRGEVIGYAGRTGTGRCGCTHLHFQLNDAAGERLDPYGLYAARHAYPAPAEGVGAGSDAGSYWLPSSTTYGASTAPMGEPGGAVRSAWLYANGGWWAQGLRFDGPSVRGWRLSPPGAEPPTESPPLAAPLAGFDSVEVTLRAWNVDGDQVRLQFATAAGPGYSTERERSFPVLDDGLSHTYLVHLGDNPSWWGTLTGLRLAPASAPAGSFAGGGVVLERLRLVSGR